MSVAGLTLLIPGLSTAQPGKAPAEPQTVEALGEERKILDATLYANETAAQEHEQAFVKLWDAMRAGSPFEALKRFQFSRLLLGTAVPGPPTDLGVEGIMPADFGPPLRTLSHGDYVKMIESLEASGCQIAQS